MCIIQDTKHETKASKYAVQTNQQMQGCQSRSSQTILEMLNQLSLYSLVIKYNFNHTSYSLSNVILIPHQSTEVTVLKPSLTLRMVHIY